MKKVFAITGFAVTLLLAFSLTGFADTWTGWISDSGCGAKGASASHKNCATTCVKEKGAKWVLVNSADKKVYAIDNQDAVSEGNVGMEVKVTGDMKGNAIHVESIAAAGVCKRHHQNRRAAGRLTIATGGFATAPTSNT